MAKGLFSQGVCLLTDDRTTIKDIKVSLQQHGFEIVKETNASGDWQFGGASLVVPYLPDVNGYVAVDVVNHPWPDKMGDPKTDVITFGAWSMGQFGPWTFPGGLLRASQHAWAWPQAKTIANGHSGFVRVRLSYSFGAKDNSPVLPKNYDPLAEMKFVSRVVLAVLGAPGVICYFNPNGEVLRDRSSFVKMWEECDKDNAIPLPLWVNIRFFNLSDQLVFMDTVGNSQLDIMDIEAIFPSDKYQPKDVDYYLRNVTHYLMDAKPKFKTGESIDGPNETGLSWTVEVLDDGLVRPPRKILRLYPKASRDSVLEAVADLHHSQA